MIKKLKKYKLTKFQSLSSEGYNYELTFEIGIIFKRDKTVNFTIPEHCSITEYTEHWDNVIKNNFPNRTKETK